MKFIKKLFKILIAFFLLPFCIGSTIALWKIISLSGSLQMTWITLLAGALFFVLIYIFLPEPKWIYVLGHELTHALWSFPFGGKLKKIKVSSKGGHVSITKSNFLVSLAPYFFPLYVVLIIIIFWVGNIFWNWASYVSLFYFLIGMAYAFHLTLTFRILKIKQPDIITEGYIFSTVVVFLGNIIVLLIGIPLLTTKINISTSLNLWLNSSLQIYHYLLQFINW